MKKILSLIAGALVIAVGVTSYAYASTSPTTSSNTRLHMGKGYGAQVMTNIVSKLTGLTSDAILKERESGKSYLDIVKSKGISEDKFKEEAIKEKTALIDEKVKDGTLTKDQGDIMKERIKTNISNCTSQGSNLKGGFGNAQGMGGRRGGMNRSANCTLK